MCLLLISLPKNAQGEREECKKIKIEAHLVESAGPGQDQERADNLVNLAGVWWVQEWRKYAVINPSVKDVIDKYTNVDWGDGTPSDIGLSEPYEIRYRQAYENSPANTAVIKGTWNGNEIVFKGRWAGTVWKRVKTLNGKWYSKDSAASYTISGASFSLPGLKPWWIRILHKKNRKNKLKLSKQSKNRGRVRNENQDKWAPKSVDARDYGTWESSNKIKWDDGDIWYLFETPIPYDPQLQQYRRRCSKKNGDICPTRNDILSRFTTDTAGKCNDAKAYCQNQECICSRGCGENGICVQKPGVMEGDILIAKHQSNIYLSVNKWNTAIGSIQKNQKLTVSGMPQNVDRKLMAHVYFDGEFSDYAVIEVERFKIVKIEQNLRIQVKYAFRSDDSKYHVLKEGLRGTVLTLTSGGSGAYISFDGTGEHRVWRSNFNKLTLEEDEDDEFHDARDYQTWADPDFDAKVQILMNKFGHYGVAQKEATDTLIAAKGNTAKAAAAIVRNHR